MPTLEWIGKDKVINHHQEVPYRVLEKKYTYGMDNDKESDNKIIRGDNLLALKSLLPQYEGIIDCIYIDPPYNTGEEKWKYNDNVNDPRIKKWLGEVVGKEEEDLSRHDKWLCMMYPRLKLLHKLLSPSGLIFISISHIEHANLKIICNEIFGISNFLGELTWESTTQPINSGKAKYQIQQKSEFILTYAKRKVNAPTFILKNANLTLNYPHVGKLGKCRFEIIEKSDAGGYKRDTMKFQILGQSPRPGKRWQIGEQTANDLIIRNRIELIDGIIKKAVYPEDELEKNSFTPFWSHYTAKEVGTAQTGKEELNNLMGYAVGFDTVKPVSLISEIVSHMENDIFILDSFAGSGTTAHAILKLNEKDGGNRKFILVEMMDYAESITAERVRRVIDGYSDVEGTGGNFTFYDLGEKLLNDDETINENISEDIIRQYIYYTETKQAIQTNSEDNKYFLGKNNETAYYFYYEKESITALNMEYLATVKTKADGYLIYADKNNLSEEHMLKNNIVFKKIPRDISRM